MSDERDETVSTTPKAKGGRPTSLEQHRKRIATVLSQIDNAELLIAESAISILKSDASPSVKVQAASVLADVKAKVAARDDAIGISSVALEMLTEKVETLERMLGLRPEKEPPST